MLSVYGHQDCLHHLTQADVLSDSVLNLLTPSMSHVSVDVLQLCLVFHVDSVGLQLARFLRTCTVYRKLEEVYSVQVQLEYLSLPGRVHMLSRFPLCPRKGIGKGNGRPLPEKTPAKRQRKDIVVGIYFIISSMPTACNLVPELLQLASTRCQKAREELSSSR